MIRERRAAAKAGTPVPAVVEEIPQQYNQSQTNNVSVGQAPQGYTMPSLTYLQAASNSLMESNITRAAALLQQCVLPNRSNNVKISISTSLQLMLLNQTSAPVEGSLAALCIDGGTNISLMGRVFRVIQYTNRYADMMGFASGVAKKRVRIALGVAVYTNPEGLRTLIGLHEAPYLEHNTTSLLSTGQAREHGVWVDDVLQRHGGKQMIMAHDIDGTPFTFALAINAGLFELELTYSSDDDVDTLPIVWLTSEDPWDPEVLDCASTKVIPAFDDFIEVSTNMAEMQEANWFMKCIAGQNEMLQAFAYATGFLFIGTTIYKSLNLLTPSDTSKKVKIVSPDYAKYRPLLGWQPLDTVRRTFEATTQLAKELPMRYPLRRHIKSRNPALNRRRLAEGFATDTLFASHPTLGGYTCAQLFCGLTSNYMSLHGMKSDSEGLDALEDFIREIRSPFSLRNDNSKMQTGVKWREVLRKYTIAELTTEPHHPQ